jgi:hypothetical protein
MKVKKLKKKNTTSCTFKGDVWAHVQVLYLQRKSRRSVSALSAEAYTTFLLVKIDIVKGGGLAPLTLARLG